ncbi:MAG: cytochrome c oxidase assembly protein [Pseudomonadota bacterium]
MIAAQKTALKCVGMVAVMASLSFAAVPLYDWFCRVTGYGGQTAEAEAAPDVVLDRVITVRFDSNVDRDLAWSFKPLARTVDINIGETGLAFYEATNLSDVPLAGTASFNVAPFSTGSYFTKIACFCFEMQVLQPGETVQMPVTFYVDPEIVTDLEAKFVNEITLSYTFHQTDLPEDVTDAGAVLGSPTYN